MAGSDGIEWRRAFPSRAATALTWYVVLAGAAVGLVWLLFGDEPALLADGAANPLATVLPLAVGLMLVGCAPLVLAVVRRPLVSANHYALTVRPGWVRTLVLPWARIARVAVLRIGSEPYLLVACRQSLGAFGDRPTWLDQGVLRAARRMPRAGRAAAGGFDLAVRLWDFVGEPYAELTALAAFAPDHVLIASDAEV